MPCWCSPFPSYLIEFKSYFSVYLNWLPNKIHILQLVGISFKLKISFYLFYLLEYYLESKKSYSA